METIDFNTVIAENISVVEGLIGTATNKKDGLSSSFMYRCAIPQQFRTKNTTGYIQLAKIKKNSVMYVTESLILKFVFYPVPYKNYCSYELSIYNTGTAMEVHIIQGFGTPNTFEWYCNEDADYIYILIKSKDLRVVRIVQFITEQTPYIGDISINDDPGSLEELNVIIAQ